MGLRLLRPPADKRKIQIWDCNGDAAQHWTIEPNGTVQINGKCLVTDTDGTTSEGTSSRSGPVTD